jgi:hypothetical protein
VEEKNGEERPRLAAREGERDVALGDLERTENTEIHVVQRGFSRSSVPARKIASGNETFTRWCCQAGR